ncbi:MAG: hypothetical protein DCF25_12260 [Leptolyngbya foveolarum]|uniref:NADH:ubiquinone oxidoreductase intermediate-associated protein 30 domain-containing protein n=1 Tax=Leptolyngbya foveolarum TaxID=47253 RepID=A0A2W4WBL3_9CYAN|nr:MAG: hypothetical protein DCF25_12260 [Leptolyngbya foveolarum]
MSASDQRSWDANRFLKTLNYFGEVPFVGSFRWLQQLMGQQTTFTGVNMSVLKKKIVVLISAIQDSNSVGIDPSESWQGLLKKQLQAKLDRPVHFVFCNVAGGAVSLEELAALVASAETTIVLGTSTLSTLLEGYGSVLSKSSDLMAKRRVFDFSESNEVLAAWGTLDDVVMGGVSQSGLSLDGQGQAAFAGNVSVENSGGFASVRTKNFEPPFNFLGWEGLRLRLKGDGQRYKFILRNSDGWDSPAYVYGLDTERDVWLSVTVPFSEMVPTFRAKSIPDASTLSPARVYSFQLMLSKFEYDQQLNPRFEPGPFALNLESIDVYRKRQNAPLIVAVEATDSVAEWQANLAEMGVDYHGLELEAADLQASTTVSLAEKLASLLDNEAQKNE